MSAIYRSLIITFLMFTSIFVTVIPEGDYESKLETEEIDTKYSSNNSISVIANKLGDFPGNYFKLVDNNTIIGYHNSEVFIIDVVNKTVTDRANCSNFAIQSYHSIISKIANPFVLQSDRSHVICGYEIYEIKDNILNLKHNGWNVPNMDIANNTIMEITNLENGTINNCYQGVIVSFSILINYNVTKSDNFCARNAFTLSDSSTIAILYITTTYIDIFTMQETFYNGPCYGQGSYWNWNQNIIILPSDSILTYGTSTSSSSYRGTCLRYGDSPTSFLNGQYDQYFDAEKNEKCNILSSTSGTYLDDEYIFASSGSVD